MFRKVVCYSTLITLLVGCAQAATNISVVPPSPTPSLTATVELASPSPTVIPEMTATATSTPSCSPKTSLKIMPLGDSITYGQGIVSYGGYRNLLGALLESDGYTVDFVGSQKSGEESLADADNEGHPGWRTYNLREAIASEGWLETYQPDIILLHIGSNDLRDGSPIHTRDNLSALIDDILGRLPETRIIVAQIIRTRWGSDAKHIYYNDAIPNVAASKGSHVSVVDMENVLSKGDFTTLYHPSPKGYDKMAHAWESAILALKLDAGCFTSR
jgi:lysophospholipase L1-like esterase